jgi:hypothetical protein
MLFLTQLSLGTAMPEATSNSMLFGAYFANWAQYHTAPYTHTPENLSPIAPKTDHFYCEMLVKRSLRPHQHLSATPHPCPDGFAYFCPPAGTTPVPYWATAPFGSCTDATEYAIQTVETKDTEFIKTVAGYKSGNPNLKVLRALVPRGLFSPPADSLLWLALSYRAAPSCCLQPSPVCPLLNHACFHEPNHACFHEPRAGHPLYWWMELPLGVFFQDGGDVGVSR